MQTINLIAHISIDVDVMSIMYSAFILRSWDKTDLTGLPAMTV